MLQALGPTGFNLVSPYSQAVKVDPRPYQPHAGKWIVIPSLGVELHIREGDGSNNIPQWVALHYPHTASPGAAGNSYLYAHGLWQMFGPLLYGRVGDAVLIRDHDTGTGRTFHVLQVVGPVPYNSTRYIRTPSSRPMLTLQTCVDYDLKGDRFIVIAG